LATLKARPAPLTVFDAFGHLAPVVSLRGLPAALDYYGGLLRELQARVAQGVAAVPGERIRLLWDNIAVWFAIRDLGKFFARRGANFVVATYTNAWAETSTLIDPGRPLESLAQAYSLIILNVGLQARLELMTRLAREYQVDGLVLHSARSCKPYSVGQYDLKRLAGRALDLPSTILEADIADARAWSEEQAYAQLEAFLETVEGR
jgi:benzoyl-CoA reductase/2-hydroxyglutaryl-CoA dehydratase subunit BcrC/BadD/HgdB